MKPIPLDEYRRAMRRAICSRCVGFVKNKQNPARCVHENSGRCGLFAYLVEVVDSISSVHSNSIDPYMEVLRQRVCAKCAHQDKRGFCDVRDSRAPLPSWCVLDAYFNLVVGAVEDVQSSAMEALVEKC